jgi:D-glycero-D-manno-heptose 1,7-bisphosphate phosphatase
LYCPHARSASCRCCKPRPGLIEAAFAKYPTIDLARRFLVGDALADIALAQAMGMRAFSLGCATPGGYAKPIGLLGDVLAYV